MPRRPPLMRRLWPALLGLAPLVALAAGSDYTARLLDSVNGWREARGLQPLRPAPHLGALAAEHSRAMDQAGRLSHDGFDARFRRAAAGLCVENVAHGFALPEQVVLGWQRVDTHARNLQEARVAYVGLAESGLYVTFFACDVARP